MNPATPIKVTVFPSDITPQGTRFDVTWGELVNLLSTERAGWLVPKRTLPLWSPATFRGDYRAAANVELVYALGYDVDMAPVPTTRELQAALTGRDAFFHSTSSYSPDAPRWRLLMPLSRPVTGAEYRALWRHVAASLPFKVGAEASDPSRGWYKPQQNTFCDFIAIETHA